MKIKHSVSRPPKKVWGDFFLKIALRGGTNLFGHIMVTNDQIMQGWGWGGEGEVSQMHFPVI